MLVSIGYEVFVATSRMDVNVAEDAGHTAVRQRCPRSQWVGGSSVRAWEQGTASPTRTA